MKDAAVVVLSCCIDASLCFSAEENCEFLETLIKTRFKDFLLQDFSDDRFNLKKHSRFQKMTIKQKVDAKH